MPIEVDAWWTPERARYLVEGQGAITHSLIGVGQTDWVWQDAELHAVDRPLAGALNEIEPLRRLAPYADAIGALMGVAAYVGRSRRERAAVLAGQLPREAPVTGVDAGGQAAQPTQPMQPSEDAAIRRRAVVDRVLGARDRAPEEPQAAPADAPGAEINWRVGE